MHTEESMETKSNADSRLLEEKFLSAQDLFKWRKRENVSIPQRGGIKDFEPDGSWLQAKRLEAFYEEQLSVLREPRVEKSGSLVKGFWNAHLRLVNIEKTAKFWMKMGFADQHRNWLHPEEALFLMEVNCLDVSYQGLQLSLQEAYRLFLSPATDVAVEEYQVYGHLRRLGYIVIRHAGKLELTSYERKIGLDKHMKKKNKKRHYRRGEASDAHEENVVSTAGSTKTAEEIDQVMGDQAIRLDSHNMECDGFDKNSASTPVTSHDIHTNSMELDDTATMKRKLSKNETTEAGSGDGATEPAVKKVRDNDDATSRSPTQSVPSSVFPSDPWSVAARKSLSNPLVHAVTGTVNSTGGCVNKGVNPLNISQPVPKTKYTNWDFKTIKFPNMAGKDTVVLEIPSPQLLPPNTALSEEFEDVCMFDVEDYRIQQHTHMASNSWTSNSDTNFGRLKDLQFSYAEWVREHSKPVVARNWGEWKAEMLERSRASLLESPVAHLWRGDVTPLVQPKDSASTPAILDKLSIIKPYQGPLPAKSSVSNVKIVFDVYLPNTTFKKSSPGVPDHRVCVARGQHPPDFFEVHSAIAYLEDDVPLHWAVVNSGEISFFIFENSNLPVHPSSLG